ncbi:MAG: tetraacyldisaccharide 4'-kinase, partial [Pyrinomonadaceae bacterium]
KIYGAIADTRNRLYEKGVFASHTLGAKTISIGNLTVGGTGKTPLVAFAAETLFSAGEKVCILTRGYGRINPKKRVLVTDGKTILSDARNAGDEPFELAEKLLGKAVIIADANRAQAGLWACEKFGITAFVLDDAFQHRKVKRDLDIVCIDATNPFGNGKVLPAGILREPLENLKRADAIVITRANLISEIEDLKFQVSKYNKNCPIFISHNEFSNFTEIKEFYAKQNPKSKIQNPKSKLAVAFCALGNPNNFFEQLRRENFNLTAMEIFPDHHFYTRRAIAKLEKTARENGAEILITTAKDAVKLKGLEIGLPVFVAENKIIFDSDKDFVNLLLS